MSWDYLSCFVTHSSLCEEVENTVYNEDWDKTGGEANTRAVREFLLETTVKSYEVTDDGDSSDDDSMDPEDRLRESDVDLIFQMFWLPHSHGPKMTKLLEDFKFCRDNAAVVRGWKKFDLGAFT